MHGNYYTFLVLDLARQRAAEAEAERLAHLGHVPPPRAQRIRRLIARVALFVARAADDELAQALSATH